MRWTVETNGPVAASPLVGPQGAVFVGSLDGFFFSLTSDGKVRWKKDLGARIFSSAALSQQEVVVGTDADRMHLLRRKDGAPVWSFALGPCASLEHPGPEAVRCDADSSPLAVPDGRLFFGGDALYGVGPAGQLRWRYDWGLWHARSSPALGPNGSLYIGVGFHSVGGGGGAVVAVTTDGLLRWRVSTPADVDSTPLVAQNGTIVVGCDDRKVYGLNPADGSVRWQSKTRGPVRSSPAQSKQGTIYIGSDDRRLYALAPDGAILWTFATGGRIRSSPVVDPRGTVVFGSRDGVLYAVSAQGKRLWAVDLGAPLESSVALTPDGTLVVGTDAGRLFGLR